MASARASPLAIASWIAESRPALLASEILRSSARPSASLIAFSCTMPVRSMTFWLCFFSRETTVEWSSEVSFAQLALASRRACSASSLAAGSLGELLVDSLLCLLVISHGLVQSAGSGSEGVLSVLAVLLHLLLDLVEFAVELGGHVSHALLGFLLVASHEVLELSILLKVLCVAVVTDLDHALQLSVHVGVDLSLLELVGRHDTGELGHTAVELLHL